MQEQERIKKVENISEHLSHTYPGKPEEEQLPEKEESFSEEYTQDMGTRTRMMIGEAGFTALQNAKVLVCGLGGVGGMACEALARSGVGYLKIVDHDVVSVTNINRQLIANTNTIGESKAKLWEKRLKEINPSIQLEVCPCYFDANTAAELLTGVEYVLDCIDSVSAKVDLIVESQKRGLKVISSMGAANKTDPSQLRVGDIYKTEYCRLARIMRTELKKHKVKKLTVIWSKEPTACPYPNEKERKGKGMAPASMMIVPATAGLLCASTLIQQILEDIK